MADKNLDSKSIAEALVNLTKAKGTYQEILAITKQYTTTLGLSKNHVDDMEESLQGQARAAKELHLMSTDTRRTQEEMLATAKIAENIEEGLLDIAHERAQAQADLLLKQTMLETGLTDAYAEQAKNLALAKKLGAITELQYKTQIAALQVEQKHTRHLQEEIKLQEKIASQMLEIREESEKWKQTITKISETAKAIGRDPKVFGAFVLGQMIEKGEEVLETFEKLDKSGLSLGQRVDYMRKSFSLMSVMGLSDTKGVLDGMVESYGTLNAMTDAQVDHVGHLAKQMGVSGEEAFGMVDAFSKMPGETMETAANTADFVNNLSKANGIAPGKITKDIAKNTEATALFSGKGAKGFAQAAVELHKMGVEIGTASKMAQGLLNFEDSINKQMEASVLLGREINLDKARELALSGDLEGATKEIMANIGGAAEFEKMNVLQKQALAQASGMTVEELSKAVDAQEEFNKYNGESAGWLNKSLGFVMEMGGGVTKLVKEYGMAALSLFQMVAQLRLAKALQGDTAKSSGGFFSKMFGGEKTPKIETPAIPKPDAAADAGKKLGGGGMMAGFKKNMTALADGFKEMGGSGVLKGIVNTALAGPALVVALPSIPYLLFMGLVPLKQLGDNFMNLAIGLEFMGTGKVAVGSLNLMLFSAAAVVGLAAIPFMLTMMLGKLIGAGLEGLAGGLKAMGNPAVAMGAGILSMVLLSAGASMLMFGAGVGIAAAGMSLLVASLKEVPFENLLALPLAFLGIGAGLYVMAAAGMAALPVLAALTAFALVAPALTGLGSAIGGMLGGGEGEEKEDKMNDLLVEIRGLRADLNKGGVINMDGKKVGDVIRLALNTAGTR